METLQKYLYPQLYSKSYCSRKLLSTPPEMSMAAGYVSKQHELLLCNVWKICYKTQTQLRLRQRRFLPRVQFLLVTQLVLPHFCF